MNSKDWAYFHRLPPCVNCKGFEQTQSHARITQTGLLETIVLCQQCLELCTYRHERGPTGKYLLIDRRTFRMSGNGKPRYYVWSDSLRHRKLTVAELDRYSH
jgi:hypothetical protein